jgi:hypothetical protein
MSSVLDEAMPPTNRARSAGLTPGPLLESLMHTQVSDDDDHEEHPSAAAPSKNCDATNQHFNTSARPTMSPTPSQGVDRLNQSSSKGVTPACPAPRVIHSILSDDDDDGHNSHNDEEEQTTVPLFSTDNVRRNFAESVQRSRGDNVINARDDYSDENGTEDDSDHTTTASLQGELVGPGHPTPPRSGHESMRPVSVDPSDQERKRAWSEVMRTEQELEEEEAAAALASENRKKRREELVAAKRRFVNFD